MSDIVKAVDTKSISDRLHEKVRGTLLDILTDDEWRGLVQGEVEKFCKDTEKKTTYGTTKHESELGKIVKEELELVAKQKLKETLETDEWVGTQEFMSARIKSFLEDNAATIIRDMLGAVFQEAVETVSRNVACQITQSLQSQDGSTPRYY
jgi:hypothetical protein